MMEIINHLKQSKCPECGVLNKCALEQGKSINSCWCFGETIKTAVDSAVCLCKTCFTKLNKGEEDV